MKSLFLALATVFAISTVNAQYNQQCCYNLEYETREIKSAVLDIKQYLYQIYEKIRYLNIPTGQHNYQNRKPCPDGYEWINGDTDYCYKVVTTKKSWADSQKECQYYHPQSYLAVIKNVQQHNAITDYLKTNYNKGTSCYVPNGSQWMYYTAGQRGDTQSCQSPYYWKYGGQTDSIAYWAWGQSGAPQCTNYYNGGCINYRCDSSSCWWYDYSCTTGSCYICQLKWDYYY